MIRKKDIVPGFSFTMKGQVHTYTIHIVGPPESQKDVMYVKCYPYGVFNFKFATRGLSLYTFCGSVELKGFIAYDDITPIYKPVTL